MRRYHGPGLPPTCPDWRAAFNPFALSSAFLSFPYRPVVFTVLMVFFNNMLMIPGSGLTLERFVFLLLFSPLAAWAWFGALVLFVSMLLSKAQKRAFGKTLFPFQTVVVSAGAMFVACMVPALVVYWRNM